MIQTTETYLTIARKWMMDSRHAIAVLPEELCSTLVKAWKDDREGFEEALNKLDMELTVTPKKADASVDSMLTMSLAFYPSMEYLGPRTAVIYISPSFLTGALRRGQKRAEILKPGMLSRLIRWARRLKG